MYMKVATKSSINTDCYIYIYIVYIGCYKINILTIL